MRPPCGTSAFDAIETELIGGRVLLTRARGYATRLLVEQRFDQFRTELSGVAEPVWIVESLELTGFEATTVAATARWYSAFKDRGGNHVIYVAALASVRMIGATLAFAVHAKLSNRATLSEAYEVAGLGAVDVRPSRYSLNPRG
ncbi:MAG: hypothetical protein EOO73_25245 [Myxococcales bacterium]|nr:MAG: hypothetical protein EOO73_25245 [Myxococcales bacterium]